MPTTRIQVCGRIAIELEGQRVEANLAGRQGRLLFVYLVLNRARNVSREELTAAIWPHEPPAHAASNLRVILSRLRGALGPDALEGRGELRLVLPADAWVDIEVAAGKIHEADATVHAEDWSLALPAANIAYAISGRGFLSGEYAEWVVQQRRWLEDLHLRALECDAAASLGIGRGGRRGRARRPQADQAGALSGKRLPAADGGACAPRQQRRGTARLRAAQDRATRRSRRRAEPRLPGSASPAPRRDRVTNRYRSRPAASVPLIKPETLAADE